VDGATAEIFGRPCLVCDADVSQTEWSSGPTLGIQECFIDNICRDDGDFLTYKESRTVTHTSLCQACDPTSSASSWSLLPDFTLVEGKNPPDDCISTLTSAPIPSPVSPPTPSPVSSPTPKPPTNVGDGSDMNKDIDGDDAGLSSGAITGIVIGIFAVGSIAAAVIVKRKKASRFAVEKNFMNQNDEQAMSAYP
jgi:hypothetical protein